MIQIFCAKRGAGKSKKLIELANERSLMAKGDSVYIDDDARRMTVSYTHLDVYKRQIWSIM